MKGKMKMEAINGEVEYRWLHRGVSRSVFVGNDKVGTIKRIRDGWQYFVLRSHKSNHKIFNTLCEAEYDITNNTEEYHRG